MCVKKIRGLSVFVLSDYLISSTCEAMIQVRTGLQTELSVGKSHLGADVAGGRKRLDRCWACLSASVGRLKIQLLCPVALPKSVVLYAHFIILTDD